jgi:hypothetical protein
VLHLVSLYSEQSQSTGSRGFTVCTGTHGYRHVKAATTDSRDNLGGGRANKKYAGVGIIIIIIITIITLSSSHHHHIIIITMINTS